MDNRLKRNSNNRTTSPALLDKKRAAPEDNFVSNEERRRMFRSEWTQEALPTPPAIPGFHMCWLSSTSQYDPIHKRTRMGYSPVKSEEIPGFENYRVAGGENEGLICVNEMVLYKMPEEMYQSMMAEMHHYAPLDEEEKIQVQQDQILNAKDSNGRRLGQVEGDGMNFDNNREVPTFQ
jgi:hypothetical protein